MSALQRTRFLRVVAFLSVLLFAGDLLADSVAEICEARCAAESSQTAPCPEKGPCQCICATHVGAVIATDFAVDLGSDLPRASYVAMPDEGTPPRLSASIDHPPQLA